MWRTLIDVLLLTLHKVYTGETTDDDIPLMPTFFYDLPSTLPRWNLYIFVNNRSGCGHALDGGSLQLFNLPEVFIKAGFDLAATAYIFDSHEGLELAKESASWYLSFNLTLIPMLIAISLV